LIITLYTHRETKNTCFSQYKGVQIN